MRRREFIAGLGSAAAWPLMARAQQGERVRRVGFLTSGDETGFGAMSPRNLLRDDLEQLGWSEGRNLQLDFRFGDGDARKTSAFAADLVLLAPDVIVTTYLLAFQAVQQHTKTIPIVIAGAGDLLENGTVLNPAHPEGNATGFSNAFSSRAGYLRSVETAAQSLGVAILAITVSDVAGMKEAIGAFAAEPNGGLLPNPGVFAVAGLELTRLAAQYRLPAIYGVALPPANGGLMSYSPDREELVRGAATYVDRLLRGAKVSDLPVQYPTKFRLTINLKTAKALGLEVPSSILVRADEVIE